MPSRDRKARRYAGVQERLPLEDIAGDIVVLRGGECRAVLQTGSVNFALKSETEQEAILAGYRRFLNGLDFPLQVLVRVLPTDVEGYLEGLRGARLQGDALRRLALDHEAFVRRIAQERVLLDRRFYVVVPAGVDARSGRSRIRWPGHRSASRGAVRRDLATARRRLAFRCSEVAQGLGAFGVESRRLTGDELIALWSATLGSRASVVGHEASTQGPVVTGRGTEAAGA